MTELTIDYTWDIEDEQHADISEVDGWTNRTTTIRPRSIGVHASDRRGTTLYVVVEGRRVRAKDGELGGLARVAYRDNNASPDERHLTIETAPAWVRAKVTLVRAWETARLAIESRGSDQ